MCASNARYVNRARREPIVSEMEIQTTMAKGNSYPSRILNAKPFPVGCFGGRTCEPATRMIMNLRTDGLSYWCDNRIPVDCEHERFAGWPLREYRDILKLAETLGATEKTLKHLTRGLFVGKGLSTPATGKRLVAFLDVTTS